MHRQILAFPFSFLTSISFLAVERQCVRGIRTHIHRRRTQSRHHGHASAFAVIRLRPNLILFSAKCRVSNAQCANRYKQIAPFALRMRWLWLQRTENQRSWHELPIEREFVVDTMFQSSISVELGNGHKALFWSDRWLEGHSIPELAPCLCNAVGVGARVNKKRMVAEALPFWEHLPCKYSYSTSKSEIEYVTLIY